MLVLPSTHAGELLTRLVGGRKNVLVACQAAAAGFARRDVGLHAPESKAPPSFFQRALRIS